MDSVHLVTQEKFRVEKPGWKPSRVHEHPTGPGRAPSAQATHAPRACRAPRAFRACCHAPARPLRPAPARCCRLSAPACARAPTALRAPARSPCAPQHARPARPSTHAQPPHACAHAQRQRPCLLTQPRAQRLPARQHAQSTKWAVAHQKFSVLKKIFIFHYK